MSVRRLVMVWVGASLLGGILIALPDSDRRVFSFSETHGPSAVDLLGMAILVAGWLPIVALLWSRRTAIRGRPAWLAGLLGLFGVVLLVVAIGMDLGPSWIGAAAVLLVAQLVALRSVARGG